MNDDGTMARVPHLVTFAKKHGLSMIAIADLIRYRKRTESLFACVSTAQFSTAYGVLRAHVFENTLDHQTHVALVYGDIGDGTDVLVRMHSQCLANDVLHSLRCDCREQLDIALQRLGAEGRGVMLCLCQESRGATVVNRIGVHGLQKSGLNTVSDVERFRCKPDQSNLDIGAQILRALNIRSVRLLTNSPRTVVGVQSYGLSVTDQLPLRAKLPKGPTASRYRRRGQTATLLGVNRACSS
jgi:3,4-dihydroxy 2-butanone 4-phosphate synthase/GTP cyclohydrolase II